MVYSSTITYNFKTRRLKSRTLKMLLVPIQEGISFKDNLYECHYCEKQLTYTSVTVDHKIPLSKGGSNNIKNIVPACSKCNNQKGNKEYSDFLNLIYGK